MPSIEHRGPGSWRVGVRTSVAQGRKWIRRALTFPESMPEDEQRARAELAAAQLQLEVATGAVVSPQRADLTVAEFAEIWMRDHVLPTCAPTTAKTYRFFLDSRILPLIGDVPLRRLTPQRVEQCLNAIRGDTTRTTAIPPEQRRRLADQARLPEPSRPLSQRTVKHYYDTIRAMLRVAVAWDYISSNPIDRVSPPKTKKPRPHFLDDQQAVALLRCLHKEESLPFRCAVLLALLCGLRLSEVGALNLSDVNWDECSIDIRRALKYTPATGNYISEPKSEAGIRSISLPAGMMALLEETRAYHEEAAAVLGDRWRGTGRIVSSWDGTPLHHDTPSKWFRKFADRNGFEGVRFHDLRHTHATLLFANAIDAVAIASRIGHEDAGTTLRYYAHAIRRRDLESAAAMQRLLDAAFPPDPDSDPDAPTT